MGATQWPVLPIGLCLALFVGTRWDRWFVLRHLPPQPQSRARMGARYVTAPLLPFAGIIALGLGAVWLNTLDDWFARWTLRWLNWIAGASAGVVMVEDSDPV